MGLALWTVAQVFHTGAVSALTAHLWFYSLLMTQELQQKMAQLFGPLPPMQEN